MTEPYAIDVDLEYDLEHAQGAERPQLERRVEAVTRAWVMRDLPLDWLKRGVEAIPGVLYVEVAVRPTRP